MKAKELMIGDWVKFPFGNEKIIDLPYIPGKGICASFAASATLFPVEVEKLQPVTLTPEILENIGFIEDNTNGLQSTYHLLVPAGIEKNIYTVQVTFYKEPICGVSTLFKCWGPYREGVNDIHLCNLHYAHEMQHVFRLCGITHNIEI